MTDDDDVFTLDIPKSGDSDEVHFALKMNEALTASVADFQSMCPFCYGSFCSQSSTNEFFFRDRWGGGGQDCVCVHGPVSFLCLRVCAALKDQLPASGL